MAGQKIEADLVPVGYTVFHRIVDRRYAQSQVRQVKIRPYQVLEALYLDGVYDCISFQKVVFLPLKRFLFGNVDQRADDKPLEFKVFGRDMLQPKI